jgi:hypothetical protein
MKLIHRPRSTQRGFATLFVLAILVVLSALALSRSRELIQVQDELRHLDARQVRHVPPTSASPARQP